MFKHIFERKGYIYTYFYHMNAFLNITPGELPTAKLHQYLLSSVSPRPIAWASTISRDGVPNLSPFSFFNVFSAAPPILIFSPARRVRDNSTKDTLTNVYEVPEVVINIVSHALVQQMNLSSCEYPTGVNEFEKAGLSMLASDTIRPFRVAESPVQIECKVIEIKPLSARAGAGNLILCEVKRMHISRSVLLNDESIDPHLIDTVGRMGKDYYVRASGGAVFEVEKPLAGNGIGIDALPTAIRLSMDLTGNDLGRLGNAASLPDESEITKFIQEHSADFLAMKVNHPDFISWIRRMLDQGRKQEALCALMAYYGR